MAEVGFQVGTATGGGTFLTEDGGGTRLAPVGIAAWGGAGTITRVGPTMAAALPVGIYGGTLNAGTVTVANTGTVVGTVATSNAGTLAMVQAGSVQVTAGTFVGTVAVSNTGTVAGTVAVSTIAAGTVVATAAGTQPVTMTVGAGKTLTWGTINLTSGSVSLVNPGAGTTAYIVGITLTAGTAGIIQFLQGVGAAALSGPIHLDQYGGFVAHGQPSSPILKATAGSQIYLSITSGVGTAGGFYSYFTEV